jgi:hypothetical protein
MEMSWARLQSLEAAFTAMVAAGLSSRRYALAAMTVARWLA